MNAAVRDRIRALRDEKNAIILAHNYQPPEIQDIADFTGDSLELSVKAAKTTADTIVFCGVRFMAETAKILSPDKTVLLPSLEAGCPMADMATATALREAKKERPGLVTVCYVNSSAEVKAECDICCASANAARVVASIPPDREILFLPDRNLGAWVAKQLGRRLSLWPGFCPTHARIRPEEVHQRREEYPDAVLIVHPECVPEVAALADEVLSTGGMLAFARKTSLRQILVGTETGLISRMKKESPDKTFIPLSARAVCPNMKRISLTDVVAALEKRQWEIALPEPIRRAAEIPIRKMLELA